MSELILIEPTLELETAVMQYRDEYIIHNEAHINGSCGLIHYPDYRQWLFKVISAQKRETSFLGVPASTYFTVRLSDQRIIGSIQLRHELNEDL